MQFELTHCDPREVVANSSLEEIEAAVQAHRSRFNEATARVLDQIYLELTMSALHTDRDEAAALDEHFDRVLVPSLRRELAALDDSPFSEWIGWSRLMKRRRKQRPTAGVDEVGRVKHAPKVLRALHDAGGVAYQKDLHGLIGLRKENAYRLITKLVLLGVVEKRIEGRENRLALTEAGRAIVREEMLACASLMFSEVRHAASENLVVRDAQLSGFLKFVREAAGLGARIDADVLRAKIGEARDPAALNEVEKLLDAA